jgi:hypothetical protein
VDYCVLILGALSDPALRSEFDGLLPDLEKAPSGDPRPRRVGEPSVSAQVWKIAKEWYDTGGRPELLPSNTEVFFTTAAEGETERFRNQSTNSVTGVVLGERHEWIWILEPGESKWRKLIPGRCPQWRRDGAGFYYFQDVGYDGPRAQLWSANAAGEARLRLTPSDYFINEGPVMIATNNRSLAYCHQTCRASGDFWDVVVIDFGMPSSGPAKTEARVVFRTKASIEPQTLRWIASGRLSVVVDGAPTKVDATVAGTPQLP